MLRVGTTLLMIAITLGLMTGSDQARACEEFFQSTSSPHGNWLGLHTDGFNYGAGQSFTLDCDSRLESVAFKIYWGNDYGAVRSLAFGDTVHVSILTLGGVELARKSYMIDTSLANRTVTFQFTPDNVLLVAGTYLAVCWTDVAACGGMGAYNADVVAGTRYLSTSASDLASWSATTGELVHTIFADSDVTPVYETNWSSVKARFR